MAVAEVVRSSGLRGYWAVAELEAVSARAWTGFPNLVQPQGTLGLRLWAINKTLIARHGACVVMGADAPGLQVSHLLEADRWLRDPEPRVVVGPARDGGFWLFGANRNLTRRFWAPLRFDPNDRVGSFAAFRSALDDLGVVLDLPVLSDLDHDQDLAAVIADLTALEQPLSAQRELLLWLVAQQQRLVGP